LIGVFQFSKEKTCIFTSLKAFFFAFSTFKNPNELNKEPKNNYETRRPQNPPQ